jgi:hypothetical protein
MMTPMLLPSLSLDGGSRLVQWLGVRKTLLASDHHSSARDAAGVTDTLIAPNP